MLNRIRQGCVKLGVLLIIFVFNSFAFATPKNISFQSKIYKPDGTPLTASSVQFKFSLMNPLSTCVIYTETFSNVDLSASAGSVVLTLGSGTRTYPVAGGMQWFDAFNNATSSYTCQASGTFSPALIDSRRLVMQFNAGGDWQTLPPMDINSVPFAMFAESAETVPAAGITQSGATVGQVLKWNGSSWAASTDDSTPSGSVSGVSSANLYLSVANGGTTPILTVNVGAAANTVAAGNDARIVGAFQSATALSGDLTGTLPNATIAPGAVTNAKITSVAWGKVTGTPTTIAGYSIADALSTGTAYSGDVSGTYNSLSLMTTGVGAGTYSKVTVDTKGRVTSGAQYTSADITAALGYTPSASGGQWVNNAADIGFTAGRVGIGIAAPAQKLDVVGDIQSQQAANESILKMETTGAAIDTTPVKLKSLLRVDGNNYKGSEIEFWNLSGNPFTTSSELRLRTSLNNVQNNALTIDKFGRVGINTITPAHTLDVSGDINVTGNFRVNGNPIGAGAVTSVGATLPITSSGGATPNISMAKATAGADGYLGSGDFTTFNNKLSSALTSANIFVGSAGHIATGVVLSGDATISNSGVLSLNNSATARSNLGLGDAAVLSVGTGAGTVAAGNDSRFTDSRAPSGAASGDLTGTYPNPTLVTLGGGGTGYKVSYDTKGRVLSATGLVSTDITTSLGYVPTVSQWTTNASGDISRMSYVGVGTTSPIAPLHVSGGPVFTDGYQRTMTLHAHHPALQFKGISDTNHSGGILYDAYSSTEAMRFIVAASTDDLISTGRQAMTIKDNGNVGIGITNPLSSLAISGDVSLTGTIKISGGTPGNGKVLTSDASGNATWSAPAAGSKADATTNGYLGSSDYTTFNNKLSASLNSGLIFVGNGSNLAEAIVLSGDATINASGILSLNNSATARTNLGLGTAAALNVPAAGDAGVGEVVKGTDSRLTNSRAPAGSASGDLTGTYPGPSLAALHAGGTGTKITYDTKGRVTGSASLISSDITAALVFTPVNRAGDTMTGTLNLPANGLQVANSIAISGDRVGVGTGTPQVKMDVAGAIKIANDAVACSAGVGGTMRWTGTHLMFCDGVAWKVVTLSTPVADVVKTGGVGSSMDVTGPGSPAYGSNVTFTFTNQGSATTAVMSAALSSSVSFEIVTDNCTGLTLAPAATCTVIVRPKASADGALTGSNLNLTW